MTFFSKGKSSDVGVKTSGSETNPREDALDAPLLSDEERQENVEISSASGPLENVKRTPQVYLAGALAVASVGSSIVALSTSPTSQMIFAGIIGCGLGPYGYYQQRKLSEIMAFRAATKELEGEIENLEMQNEYLMQVIEELNETVNDLELIESAFKGLNAMTNQSVKDLEKQVEANRHVLVRIKYLKRTLILQNVVRVLIACDSDGDYNLRQEEVDQLTIRMRDICGAKFKSNLMRSTIRKNGMSLRAIIESVKTALLDHVDTEMFTFEKDDEDEENDLNASWTNGSFWGGASIQKRTK